MALPIYLTANPLGGNVWQGTCTTLTPTSSPSQTTFILSPPTGTTFPATPPTPSGTTTDNVGGSYTTTVTISGTPSTTTVDTIVTITPSSGNFGPGLNILINLNY
jgi:hypothetical protein